MVGWRWLALGVVGVLASIVPLAHASPPDPTWIPGLYDDADFDDVVIAVTGQHVALDLPIDAPQPLQPLGRMVAGTVIDAADAPVWPSAFPRSPPTTPSPR